MLLLPLRHQSLVLPNPSNLHARTKSMTFCPLLTTDGLWAMPVNTGWVPVKECRLQDWENLKKYVPVHKQGDGVPGLPEKGNANDDNHSE